MANPGTLRAWIEHLPSQGRYAFTRSDAEGVSHASREAVEATLRRLRGQGSIVTPRRGFHVIVPPEYRAAACPPASWFIDELMNHLRRRYYVGLLSAAALHGAGHQQPMGFQVITDARERDIELGRVRVEFHASNLVEQAATAPIQTATGTMIVSTPETTAFDLIRFPGASGYWSNIATVLAELAEVLDAGHLVEGASRVARSDTQRLGWILDTLSEEALAAALGSTLEGQRLVPTPLNTKRDAANAVLDPRWRVLVNDDVEPDA